MEPNEEKVFHSLCSNNERLMREMNDYLASISNTPDVSIKTGHEKLASENEDSFDDDDEGTGRTRRNNHIDSATGGETDDDSLVAMALHMDAASVISGPLEKGYYSHVPPSPRMEISARMEEMLAQFTNSDPSIKDTMNERFNHSDPSTTKSSLHSQNIPPSRSYPMEMGSQPPASQSPSTQRFDKTKCKSLKDPTPPAANILPFPSFGNMHERRRLSLERMSDVEASTMNASMQHGRKTTRSVSKYNEPALRKNEDVSEKHNLSSPSAYSKRESTGSKTADTNIRQRKGWHKKTIQERGSDDEMCGVGINTRVHDEEHNGSKKSSKNSKNKRDHHHTERRHSKSDPQLMNNIRMRSREKRSSSRTGVERSEQSKSHSEKRRHRRTHRRTKTSQSGDNNLATERLPNQAKSSSPKYSRRLSSEGRSDGSADNHSTYDSDDETQFFYESTDDEDEKLDSEDDMKAVGTSVIDAVKDLNERSAVAKVKNLFKLHH